MSKGTIKAMMAMIALTGGSLIWQQRNALLTNGGNAPIPAKMLNQRQKRKRNRQTNNFN